MDRLSPKHKLIYLGLLCPYCFSDTHLVSDLEVYGRTYNRKSMLRVCDNYPKCDAYVATHDRKGHGNEKHQSMGRLAKKKLRGMKIEAHKVFDKLHTEWGFTRPDAYKWLSRELEIDPVYCHIGYFSYDNCCAVINRTERYIKRMAREYKLIKTVKRNYEK